MTLALALVLAAAAEPPTFDALVKETSAANTPIVLDVFTTWCKPCLELEKTTLTNPTVLAALSKARLIRYDAERGPGVEVAERFGIHSYPSVLLLTPEGTLMTSLVGRSPVDFIAEVTPLLPVASVRGPFTDEALAKKDVDPRALYIAGLTLAKKAPAKAAALFARAAARDPDGAAGVRGEATALGARYQYEAALTEAKIKALAMMAEGDPSASATIDALGMLSKYPGQFDVAKAKATGARIGASLAKSKNKAGLNGLVYAQLALTDTDGALVTAKALEAIATDTGSLDTVAEAYFQANQKEKAIEVEEAALKAQPSRALKANLARFQSEEPSLPPFEPVRNPLPDPEPEKSPMTAFFDAQRQLGAALAGACAASAGNVKMAYVRLTFTGPTVTKAVAFDIETPPALKQCLEKNAKGKLSPMLRDSKHIDVQVPFPLR